LFSGIDASGEGGLEERMQALGGEWNAYTSNADTTFVIEAPAKNQRKVLDLLLALLTQTRFDDNAINAAKQVVEREDGGHYSPAALARPPGPGPHRQQPTGGGTGPQMPGAGRSRLPDPEQLEKVRKDWYAPNNMTLIVVGDLDRLLPAYLERTYGALERSIHRAPASATDPGQRRP
jgi:predicted Zn-dependent peptidase